VQHYNLRDQHFHKGASTLYLEVQMAGKLKSNFRINETIEWILRANLRVLRERILEGDRQTDQEFQREFGYFENKIVN
jgi:hypothetical protein